MESQPMKAPWKVEGVRWSETCSKWMYPNRDVAMRELLVARATRAPQERKERAIYACETCEGWHLTYNAQAELDNNAPEVREAVLESKRKAEEYKRRRLEQNG